MRTVDQDDTTCADKDYTYEVRIVIQDREYDI